MSGTAEVRTYPQGVTCWVDTRQPDVDAATRFYAELFGWTFADAMPPDAPERYVIAQLGGRDAAGIGGPGDGPATWSTYVAVDDCDTTARAFADAGATILVEPVDAGPGGRTSTIADPQGAVLHLWQARARPGAQALNEPGAWNFSDLRTPDPAGAATFYSGVLGWQVEDQGWATSIKVPGYGDHLESTVDPDIRSRQAHAPEGFADVIGGMARTGDDESAHWHVTFTVADRDATVATAERLGAVVLSTSEDDWTRKAVLRDPQGAVFTASQFAPKSWG